MQCAGVCPGKNTFCVAEPEWHEQFFEKYGDLLPRNELGGMCVLKVNDYKGCRAAYASNRARDSVQVETCTAFLASIDYKEDVYRFVGSSGAEVIQAHVCLPEQEEVRACN
jgi:hypothetical protein